MQKNLTGLKLETGVSSVDKDTNTLNYWWLIRDAEGNPLHGEAQKEVEITLDAAVLAHVLKNNPGLTVSE